MRRQERRWRVEILFNGEWRSYTTYVHRPAAERCVARYGGRGGYALRLKDRRTGEVVEERHPEVAR